MSEECINRLLQKGTSNADKVDKEIFESFWGMPDHFGFPREDVETWLNSIKEHYEMAQLDKNQPILDEGYQPPNDEILKKVTTTPQSEESANQNALKISYSFRFEGHCTEISSGP